MKKSGEKRKKTAVFGGTFDPVHFGHINMGLKIIEKKLADEVLFIPSALPPHKTEKNITDFKTRCEMLNLALSKYSKLNFSKIENLLPKPSYTLNTMEKLSEKFPNKEIKLLIGSDTLLQIHTWHKAVEIIENWKLIVYPRPGYDVNFQELSKHWSESIAEKLLSMLIKGLEISASSTNIKHDFKNENIPEKEIPENVLKYILDKKIYL